MNIFEVVNGVEYEYIYPHNTLDEDEDAEYLLVIPTLNKIEDQNIVNQLNNIIPTISDFCKNLRKLKIINRNIILDNIYNLEKVDESLGILNKGCNANGDSMCNGIDNVTIVSIILIPELFLIFRKIHNPISNDKNKLLHSMISFTCDMSPSKNMMYIETLCVNKCNNLKGGNILLNFLIDMCIPLKINTFELTSVDTINTVNFYIKNSLFPKFKLNRLNIFQLVSMINHIDIRIRPNWKINKLVKNNITAKSEINNKFMFTRSHSDTLKNSTQKISKFDKLINFMQNSKIYKFIENKLLLFDKSTVDEFKKKILITKEKNKELLKIHNRKIKELKK